MINRLSFFTLAFFLSACDSNQPDSSSTETSLSGSQTTGWSAQPEISPQQRKQGAPCPGR